ncbi:MAG: lysophospholipid acyltransferase family protein [Flavobacterium sp.]
MEKIISYPISFISMILFVSALIIFQPIQWFCLNVFGYQAHKKSVDALNFFLITIPILLGNTFKVKNLDLVPKGVPLIIVSNHQSFFDIVGILWFLNAWHPKFVAKKELAKNFPSVSFNLKYGGSALIDREDPKQAIPAIKKLSEYIEENNRSAVIFPEGTRSRNGNPKPFSQSGLKVLCKYAPSAYVVPITINNSWKFLKFGTFPYGLGNPISFTIHKPMAVKDYSFDELTQKTEQAIVQAIKN